MDDHDILKRIQQLVDEEHTLREGGELDRMQQERRDSLEVQLDQCWDLLRQRRAMRETGQNPDQASLRPEGEVEGYLN